MTRLKAEKFTTWTESVPAGSKEVGEALRRIASRIETDDLCLVSIYSTGFGEAWEATLQVIATSLDETARTGR